MEGKKGGVGEKSPNKRDVIYESSFSCTFELRTIGYMFNLNNISHNSRNFIKYYILSDWFNQNQT